MTAMLRPDADPRAWFEAIVKLGVPAAIAMFLIWVLTGVLMADVRATKGDVATVKADVAAMHDEQRARIAIDRDTLRVLVSICVSIARTESERANCEVSR